MKELGLKLKNRREELGYTLEEMSTKTKIQGHYLKAIENGDLEFFKDDFSYLRYFVRFYCQALNFDFESVRDEFDNLVSDFNKTQAIKIIEDREQKHEKINKMVKEGNLNNSYTKEKRKIDYSMVSLVTVVAVMIIAVAVVVYRYGPSWFEKKELTPTPEIINVETDKPTATPTSTPTPETEVELDISTLDGYQYEIRGWKEDQQVSIVVEFARDTWIRVSYNGVVSDNPVSKIYNPSESMEILVNAKEDYDITIHFGAIKDNKVLINGKEYTLDDKVKDLMRGQQLHFILKGE